MITDLTGLADVNGVVTPLKDAKISLIDRGFIFGDSVYEVLGTKNGIPIFFEEHLERLSGSLKGIRLFSEKIIEKVRERSYSLLKMSRFDDGVLYIQITRGICPQGKRCDEPHPDEPTIAIMVYPHPPHNDKNYEKGVRLITKPEIRWKYCNIKTNNLLPRVLARMDAQEAGAYEAVFISEQGNVLECSATNIFAVFNGELVTPYLGERLLPGITRQILIKAARNIMEVVEEKNLSLKKLLRADEVFITGTSTEVLGVVQIDDHVIGSGKPEKWTKKLHAVLKNMAGNLLKCK
jgi:D-alanine transaminase